MEQHTDPSEPDQAELDTLIQLQGQRQFETVLAKGSDLAARHPHSAMLQNLLGGASAALRRHDVALAHYHRAIELNPNLVSAHNNLANLLQGMGRGEEAVAGYRRAIEIKPDYANAHFNLGNALKKLGRVKQAAAAFERTLAIKPDHVLAHNNLGNAFRDLGRPGDAGACFKRALQIQPGYADAHSNLGNVLLDLGRPQEAVASYERALASNPNHLDAYIGMGHAVRKLQYLDRAIANYEQALRIRPDHDLIRAEKLYLQAHVCDWEAIAAEGALIARLGIDRGSITPFSLLALEDAPNRHRQRSEKYARDKWRRAGLARIARPTVRPERLRIGYFSADFHNHATMYLMARLFELHDRERFSIHAFSYGAEKNDEMQQRVKEAADAFHDVRALNDRQVAELARREGIDIAIDLKSHTTGSRLDIFAWGAAPIQISYLGYPGTSGAPFIDYVIADRITVPAGQQAHYSEQIIYLPDSYQVNDDTRRISDRAMTRSELGLPETGFVFCCFNDSYKITPTEFDIWMRLLDRVEGSVLWLLKTNDAAESNLREEAARRGIDVARLIFADRAPQDEHLARHRLADLFLDTFAYNAHTTASDALWAGLPVLTMPGQGFPARVGASLLKAVGLPDLVAASAEDYESQALELAIDADRLFSIRNRLSQNRTVMPLFDSERFARHIEDAYQQAYQRWFDALAPATIEIPPRP